MGLRGCHGVRPSNPPKPASPLTALPSATWTRTSQSCSSSSRPSAPRKPNSFSSLRRARPSQPSRRKLSPARLGPAHLEPSWVQILYGPVAPFSPVRGVQSFPRHQAPDAVGPVGHKQRGPDIRRVGGAGRAWGLGFCLLQHLSTATGVNSTALGTHPSLRALRGWGAHLKQLPGPWA